MKLFTPLLLASALLLTAATCNKTTVAKNCFKGRLAIKGICMNYVITVLEGDTAALNLEKTWVDETDNKTYNNAFTLGSKCDFPDIKEGDEFYFTIDKKNDTQCNVCLAYRPVPAASNAIVVSKTPCL